MIIPWQSLSAETLEGVLDSIITREGTDYGECEFELAEKREQLKRQLQQGELQIAFDAETESVNLLTPTQVKQLLNDGD